MGLDMYLIKHRNTLVSNEVKSELFEIFNNKLGGTILFSFCSYDEEKEYIENLVKEVCGVIENKAMKSISEEVGYFRKANQIHNWFVKNVQCGVDDCRPHLVTKEQLEKLYDTIDKVMLEPELAPALLPTSSGFWFGSMKYDEYYFETLHLASEVIDSILSHTDFSVDKIEYQSSW